MMQLISSVCSLLFFVVGEPVPQPLVVPQPRFQKVCQGGMCRMVPIQAPASKPEQPAILTPTAPTPNASPVLEPTPADPATRPIEVRTGIAYPVQPLRSVLVKRGGIFRRCK